MQAASTDHFENRYRALARQRAKRIALEGADFIERRAAEELLARLGATNRVFARAILVGDETGLISAGLNTFYPDIDVTNVRVEELDREDNGFAPACFDLIISGLSLHASANLSTMLMQVNDLLAPDGLFMGALPGEGTLVELRDSLLRAEAASGSGAGARVEPFIDISTAGALLQQCGFTLPVVDMDRFVVRYSTLAGLITDLRAMGATSTLDARARPVSRRARNLFQQFYQDNHSDSDGRLRASCNLVFMTAWTAHESQQKPMRPGTASVRLADYLNKEK
ncbi:MAG: SAM-dependent methyltransferase [Rhizobiaceae bacterium]